MPLTLPSRETLYAALIARDPAYDGHAFVGVRTTGVFCRLTCAARKPRFENTRFFGSIPACLEAGFRPCLRCRPLNQMGARTAGWDAAGPVGARAWPKLVRRGLGCHAA